MSEHLPNPVRARLVANPPEDDDFVTITADSLLVRVHSLGGPHPLAWNEFRRFGPTSSRFDHHTMPRRPHNTRRVAYLTFGDTAFCAALAEFFQDAHGGVGPIDTGHQSPYASAFRFSSPVRLLDLDSGWITRAGGNQAIRTGPRGRSRSWARAIYATYPDIPGLAYSSSVWGRGRCLALWERCEHVLPAGPETSRALNDPLLGVAVADATETLGTFPI